MWCAVVVDGSVSLQSYRMATTDLRLELGIVVACSGLCYAVWHYYHHSSIIHALSMGVRLYYSVIVGMGYAMVL